MSNSLMARSCLVALAACIVWLGIATVHGPAEHSLAAPVLDWQAEPLPGPGSLAVVSSTDAWFFGEMVDAPHHTLTMHWDGSTWTTVPSPNVGSGSNALYSAAVVDSRDIWLSGQYQVGGGHWAPLVLHWDGASWQVMPGPNIPNLDQVSVESIAATSASDAWLVGYRGTPKHREPVAVHWDGTRWTETPIPLPPFPPLPKPNPYIYTSNQLISVTAVAPDDVWAVGAYGRSNDLRALVEHWNGRQWSAVPNPAPPSVPGIIELNTLTVSGPSDIWAAGNLIDEGNNPGQWRTLLEHWDGQAWSIVPSPNLSNVPPGDPDGGDFISSIVAVASNDVWASGYYQDNSAAETPERPLVLHWDGATWSNPPAPLTDAPQARIRQVTAGSDHVLWAIGFTHDLGTFQGQYYLLRPTGAGGRSATPTVPAVGPTPIPVPTVEIPGAGSRLFPETGKTVTGLFLDYWNKHGGLAQQGYPISAVTGEVSDLNGQPYTVQYFERAVFEYHPENQTPFNVLLSQLGTFQYKKKYPSGAPDQTADQTNGHYFAETGHWVGGKFWPYWQAHGGLAQQGYPISEEFTETSDLNGKPYTVQYFERAVFELHPENQPPYDVLLSQLGTFRYKAKYGGR